MINPEGTQSTFWRICDDNGNCHCDWRLTLGDCDENDAMHIIYIINIIGSAIVSVIGNGKKIIDHSMELLTDEGY